MLFQHFIRARVAGVTSLAKVGAAARLAAIAVLVMAASPVMPAAQQQLSTAPSDTFIIFIRGERIGSEDVALTRTAGGWTITSSGRIGPPLDLVIREVHLRYTADWKPIELKIAATDGGV